ncbi:unnamed protein product, partial [Rotaria sp. Silwood2]
CAEQHNQW